MAPVVVEATEGDVTGVAGTALVEELTDRLGVVEVVARRDLRPIGPGGHSGGERCRRLVEPQLAGEGILSDVYLFEDTATRRLRGEAPAGHPCLASHTTLDRILAGADAGRVVPVRAAAANRDVLPRTWTLGPRLGRVRWRGV